MLVFDGLMLGRIAPIVLSIAIANGNTCCRGGRHRRALALSAGYRSGLTAGLTAAAHATAAASLTATADHARVMLRLLLRRLLLLHV